MTDFDSKNAGFNVPVKVEKRPPSGLPATPPPLPAGFSGGNTNTASASVSVPKSSAKTTRRKHHATTLIVGHLVASVLGLAIGWFIVDRWIHPNILNTLIAGAPENAPPAAKVEADLPRAAPANNPPAPKVEEATGASVEIETPANGSDERKSEPKLSPLELHDRKVAALTNGDLPAALQAASQLAAYGGQDVLQSKLEVIAAFREQAVEAASWRAVAEASISLAHEASAALRKDVAAPAAQGALSAARRVDDSALTRRATLAVLAAEKLD